MKRTTIKYDVYALVTIHLQIAVVSNVLCNVSQVTNIKAMSLMTIRIDIRYEVIL